MKPYATLKSLRQARWYEYLIRFAFGGLVTAATGYVVNRYGPVVGGLFLAFPSIFPASVTLVQLHKEEEEEAKGQSRQEADKSAEQAAGMSAAGSAAGCFGLLGFAVIIQFCSTMLPPWLVLVVALAVWIAGSVTAWWMLLSKPN